MAGQWTREQAKAMYPNSPSLWPGGPDPVELSTYLPRRRAQLLYPASPGCWPPEQDLDAMSAHLEAEAAKIAAVYPHSVARMIAPLVNSAVEAANADIRLIDAELAANSQGEP